MPKTTTKQAEAEGTAADATKKQRKKQAKREAKMMLKVEQARKNVKKAERKVAKVQAELESSKTQLDKLEARMQEMVAPSTFSSPATEAQGAAGEQEQSTSPSAGGNEAEEPGQEDSATTVTEPEQPALLSPEVVHTNMDTDTDTAQASVEAQSTPVPEENSEEATEEAQNTQEPSIAE